MPGEWEAKAWGRKRRIAEGHDYIVEELEILPGGFCSRHFHRKTRNLFLVLTGWLVVTTKDDDGPALAVQLSRNSGYSVSPMVVHKFSAGDGATVIEISQTSDGSAYDPGDIERLDAGGVIA
jgi:mannose-6-phosphate isomerase-like protein (cupin superfamily)